jgi:putative ABC transport system permease protein
VLLFSLAIAAGAALVFGLAPALFTARRDVTTTTLRGAGRVAGGRGHLRNTLVAAEIALSLVLVLGAGLLIRTFVSVMRVDLGFDPARLTLVSMALPPARYAAPADRQRFYDESLRRIRLIPGVEAAALTSGIPPFELPVAGVALPGEAGPRDARAMVRWVTADFFRTLDIPVRRGSVPPDVRAEEAPRQVVVNQAFVRQYFAGQDAIGRRIEMLPINEPPDPSRHRVYEVAAVVEDIRNQGLRLAADPEIYVPWVGAVRGTPALLLRTAGSPTSVVKSVRYELAAVDRQVAVVQARALTEILDRSFYAQPRFSLLVLGIFAVTGIVLVAVGVFSLTAYTVSRQKKEIAVRIALGAAPPHVYSLVFRIALRLVAAGIVAGILASFATNRLLTTQLWNVSPNDPLTLIAATILVASIALAACYIPARRAMRVDPIVALREE